MRNIKKAIVGLLSLSLLSGCAAGGANVQQADSGKGSSAKLESAVAQAGDSGNAENTGKKLSIVSTNFAGYDFARAIVSDKAELKMLLKPGAESHTYEPSPADILSIQNSDLFIYAGGDSDEWVEDVLESMDQSKMKVFRLMDAVELIEEEEEIGFAPGTSHSHDHDHDDEADHHAEHEDAEHEHDEDSHEHDDEHSHEHDEAEHPEDADGHEKKHDEADHDHDHGHDHGEREMDEHVWTSPVNAMEIVEKLSTELSALDAANADSFRNNAESYIAKLSGLDKEIRELVDNASRKEIIVADRFPFGYFVKEYGLSYHAAFPGCSTDTQPSAKTVAYLLDKTVEDKIPVVFHIELSNEEMCDSISKDSGAKKELLYAMHNVSDEQFKAGVTYIDLMEHNVSVLKEALN